MLLMRARKFFTPNLLEACAAVTFGAELDAGHRRAEEVACRGTLFFRPDPRTLHVARKSARLAVDEVSIARRGAGHRARDRRVAAVPPRAPERDALPAGGGGCGGGGTGARAGDGPLRAAASAAAALERARGCRSQPGA